MFPFENVLTYDEKEKKNKKQDAYNLQQFQIAYYLQSAVYIVHMVVSNLNIPEMLKRKKNSEPFTKLPQKRKHGFHLHFVTKIYMRKHCSKNRDWMPDGQNRSVM